MELFDYKKNILHFDNFNLFDIAKQQQTPFYLYSKNKIIDNLNDYQKSLSGLDHLICYSVKANSSLSILSILAKKGCGFDIVSGGELDKSIKAGGSASNIVFSGVGKTDDEIFLGIKNNILCFNVESESELLKINSIASDVGKKANIAIRVNPEISAKTHPYIATGMSDNKFGLSHGEAIQLYTAAAKLEHIKIKGIDFHIGSQITETAPFQDSLDVVSGIVAELRKKNIELEHIDIGGGLGIRYNDERPPTKTEFINSIKKNLQSLGLKVILEPGRSIVGDSGIILSKILYIKKTPSKNFLIVDLGMNDFIRPPLYSAFHPIREVFKENKVKETYDVVGPVCESADFVGKNRNLSVKEGDFLVIENAGAYGFVLSSNYNSRVRPSEWMIIDGKAKCVRKRETIDQLTLTETIDV